MCDRRLVADRYLVIRAEIGNRRGEPASDSYQNGIFCHSDSIGRLEFLAQDEQMWWDGPEE